jgi:hypothetical protein
MSLPHPRFVRSLLYSLQAPVGVLVGLEISKGLWWPALGGVIVIALLDFAEDTLRDGETVKSRDTQSGLNQA